MTPCPCGSDEPYGACCGRLHAGERAVTAEQLMRSRFAAFAVGDEAYLRRTWHRSTRPRRLDLDPAVRWTHLEIVDRVAGGPLDTDGIVEFRAHHRVGGRPGVQAERSRFVREDGAWLYLAAE
ncbi:YchJ family protein [Pseudonocardia halophobica]|uniref:YchJ family protein n=1 Tax=Pseudonocardia halophobica TaxID=29401 RepID=UPI003D95021F